MVTDASPVSTTANVRLRLVAAFVYRFVRTMVVPFMAIYLVNELGAVTGGLLMMLVATTSVAATLVGGPLCDRVGLMHQVLLRAVGAPDELKAQLGPEASLEDVFRHHTGDQLGDSEKGGLRGIRSTRRTAGRMG